MKDGFRQTMAFLHSWAGLFPGWLLYAVFLTGSLTYYRQEIGQWMRPELSGAAADPRAAAHAIDRLRQVGPDALLWRIDLPTARNPVTEILWKGAEGGFRSEQLDPRTGRQLRGRETMGGDFLFYFHFDLNAPGRLGRWLVCFGAIAMLVAIISGIITHRRIFTDFFTFRPRKGQRSWLDAHNLAGVMALPFYLMISFTGLVTLTAMFMPWAIQRVYPSDMATYARELAGQGTAVATVPSDDAPVVSGMEIDHSVHSAERMWHEGRAGRILVDDPRSKSATVTVVRRDTDGISYDLPWLRFGADGRLIARHDGGGPAVTTQGWLYGLHLARFSGGGLRFLFFLSGLLGTAMIATGLILWVVKRRPKNPATAAPMAAERANVAVIAGLPISIAALLLANRVLPLDLSGRMGWEASAFFLSWTIALVNTLAMKPARSWTWQVRCLGALCLSAPLPQMFVPASGLFTWLRTGDMARASVDLALIITGLIAIGLTARASATRRVAA